MVTGIALGESKAGLLQARPSVVISNNSNSGALIRAQQGSIPYCHLSQSTHPEPEKLDQAILDALLENRVTVVVLAGYMKKLGEKTLSHYEGAILNIHPALLPKFGGVGMYGIHVHEAVTAAKEKETGVTIHLVDEEYDTEPIIAQTKVPIMPNDTPDTLQAGVLEREHTFFAETLQKIASGEVRINQ